MDSQQARQFIIQLEQAPLPVQYYFDSDISSQAIHSLCDKYNISFDYINDVVAYVFIGLVKISGLAEKIAKDLGKERQEADAIALDLMGMVFFPIDAYMKKYDARNAIIEKGGKPEAYQQYIDALMEKISDQNDDVMVEIIKKHEDLFDAKSELSSVLELMQNSLVSIVKSYNDENIILLNRSIIILIQANQAYKRNIEEALYRNNQKFTEGKIILDGKPAEPTISNWLKDFIKKNGSDYFDDLVLSEYLTKSQNAKNINQAERELLRKLLLLYRNVKFFSRVFAETSPDEWEIIPILQKSEEMTKARTVFGVVPPNIPIRDEHQKIARTYAGDADEGAALRREEARLKEFVKGDSQKLRAEFYKAVRSKASSRTVAALRLMAMHNELNNFLAEDEKLKKFLQSVWEKKYGKAVAEEYQKNPVAPKFVKIFLQYVLEERLEIKRGEAARIGAQLGNIYKKLGMPEYAKMAYFDMGEGEFHWLEQ